MSWEVENPMINFTEVEPKIVARCCNCGEELTEQDLVMVFEGERFCEDASCFVTYMNVEIVEGWELD